MHTKKEVLRAVTTFTCRLSSSQALLFFTTILGSELGTSVVAVGLVVGPAAVEGATGEAQTAEAGVCSGQTFSRAHDATDHGLDEATCGVVLGWWRGCESAVADNCFLYNESFLEC